MSEELKAEMVQPSISFNELSTNVPVTAQERILVVGGHSRYAATDVLQGIVGALRNQGVETLPYLPYQIEAFVSKDVVLHHVVSTAASTKNNFSHVLLIGASFLNQPDTRWAVQTMRKAGVKVGYWSLEDPHALDQHSPMYDYVDYYFSNERRTKDVLPNALYLPTAGNHRGCMPLRENEIVPDIFNHDITFCGNMYPSRQKTLEAIVPFIKAKGYRMGIQCMTRLMDNPENSPLREYIIPGMEGVVDHKLLVFMYGSSKIAINMERESTFEWNPKQSSNRKFNVMGESLNPRAYEIPLCKGAIQLIDDKRKELFGDKSIQIGKHCDVFRSPEELCDKIEYYMTHEAERKKIVDDAYDYVNTSHTYESRAHRYLMMIRLRDKNKVMLNHSIMTELKGKSALLRKQKGM